MWNMTVFIQYLVNGLSMGSVYAIIALGYTMVYGIAKMQKVVKVVILLLVALRKYAICLIQQKQLLHTSCFNQIGIFIDKI